MHRASLALFLICALASSGCWSGISKEVVATVLSIRGEVLCVSKGSTNFRAVDSNTKLAPGSIVRTSSDAEFNLRLVPGALVQISGDSELKIEELRITKDGNETGDAIRERVARVELSRGGMIVLFEGFARFTIKTRDATISVLPSCLFRLDVDQSRTRVTCIRGKLYVAPQNDESVVVDAGHFREWPSPSGAMPAAEDRQAQADTTATLQAARQLQELDAAQRDRLPF